MIVCVCMCDETGQRAVEVDEFGVLLNSLRSSYGVCICIHLVYNVVHSVFTAATITSKQFMLGMFIVCFVYYLLFINFITKINKIACKSKSYSRCFMCDHTHSVYKINTLRMRVCVCQRVHVRNM